ncbi:MAG: hypothetical protein PHT07_20745 [Paludibacter sp.]|nr:hypothetical protein [Paludibacter sp.]
MFINTTTGVIYDGDMQVGDRVSTDAEVLDYERSKIKVQRKNEIILQLSPLDQKKIRPLAEGDTTYLATLNAQTVDLRAELATL